MYLGRMVRTLRLEVDNAHALDKHVAFDEASHTYHVHGEKVSTSVSGVVKEYFPSDFDAMRIIGRKL